MLERGAGASTTEEPDDSTVTSGSVGGVAREGGSYLERELVDRVRGAKRPVCPQNRTYGSVYGSSH